MLAPDLKKTPGRQWQRIGKEVERKERAVQRKEGFSIKNDGMIHFVSSNAQPRHKPAEVVVDPSFGYPDAPKVFVNWSCQRTNTPSI
jgi:hypothetical protein